MTREFNRDINLTYVELFDQFIFALLNENDNHSGTTEIIDGGMSKIQIISNGQKTYIWVKRCQDCVKNQRLETVV